MHYSRFICVAICSILRPLLTYPSSDRDKTHPPLIRIISAPINAAQPEPTFIGTQTVNNCAKPKQSVKHHLLSPLYFAVDNVVALLYIFNSLLFYLYTVFLIVVCNSRTSAFFCYIQKMWIAKHKSNREVGIIIGNVSGVVFDDYLLLLLLSVCTRCIRFYRRGALMCCIICVFVRPKTLSIIVSVNSLGMDGCFRWVVMLTWIL